MDSDLLTRARVAAEEQAAKTRRDEEQRRTAAVAQLRAEAELAVKSTLGVGPDAISWGETSKPGFVTAFTIDGISFEYRRSGRGFAREEDGLFVVRTHPGCTLPTGKHEGKMLFLYELAEMLDQPLSDEPEEIPPPPTTIVWVQTPMERLVDAFVEVLATRGITAPG